MYTPLRSLSWRLAQSPNRLALPTLICLLVAISGCGGGDAGESVTTYPVKGKVVMADGKPLPQGLITFVPIKEGGRQASGFVDSSGNFSLTTKSEGDGAVAGEYHVRIDPALTKPGEGSKVPPKIHPKYNEESSSGLAVTVKAEPNDLPPFKLDNQNPQVKGSRSGRGDRDD